MKNLPPLKFRPTKESLLRDPMMTPAAIRREDAITALLLQFALDTPLADLYAIFGREQLTRFIEIFGGQTIKVPSSTELAALVRDAMIYSSMASAIEGNEVMAYRLKRRAALAKRHEIAEDEVDRIYATVAAMINERKLLRKARALAAKETT